MWNNSFQFDVYVPELALVRFAVEDHDTTSDNEFIGQYTLPFSSMQCGKPLLWSVQFNTHHFSIMLLPWRSLHFTGRSGITDRRF